jgi:hypothetical protein
MPAQYEAIRDKFTAKGIPLAEAKTHAAKIYNSTHHDNPVTNHSDKGMAHGGTVEHRQLAKQAAAHAEHAKGTGQDFAGGGMVPMPPTMGVSSAYPPPPGHRTEGPRNYGKKT